MHRSDDTPRLQGTAAAGISAHLPWLDGIAKWILVLNLVDGLLTLVWIEFFGAAEANPMMRDLVYQSALLFMVVKLTLVSLGTLFLWRNRSRPLAVAALFLAFFTYYAVLLIHLRFTSLVVL